ncbi:hypothetical protein [Streptomyces sp. S.PB5]|uniref:hypothetical protein n=1 Tax=Streptomyces sp. S.PB5 TaxID=3020844 RepID=UPI0025B23A8C|nr:hypothetical protein [Streptomyces sp. S.PB5]MDN3025870.1 hypothetical protein [Streptomyces sp. S.PB5]
MTDVSEAEFDACAARLGIEVPADLKGGVLRGYQGLRAMAELLRGVRLVDPGHRGAEGDAG